MYQITGEKISMKGLKTILYVDDEPINLQLFAFAFKREYHIITSETPTESIKIAESRKDLSAVISDMRMPGMNGIEMIRKVKEIHPNLPCYILTGYDINKEIKEALDENLISGYFSKPFNVNVIKTKLKKHLL
jgi:response regulator RpfG family c-di-GMP phosphodiesterase